MKEETRKTLITFCGGALFAIGTLSVFIGLKENSIIYIIYGLIFLGTMFYTLYITLPESKRVDKK